MSHSMRNQLDHYVAKFASSITVYTDPKGKYLEADVRSEFIDPLLRELGWDVENSLALTPSKRQVVREQSHPQGSAHKRPDYTLRVNGEDRLYIEAKRPSVDIRTNLDAIRQTRAYGWTRKHPIAVLTNFYHLRIFDTTVPVSGEDSATTGLIFECSYDELRENYPLLQKLIGRASVEDPAWTTQFENYALPKHLPADKRFVQQLEEWRLRLGESMVQRNATVTEEEVNDAAQRILNRLIFVRMCEDRGIEGEEVLLKAFSGSTSDIAELFRYLDRRYNTGLFAYPDSSRDPMLLVDTNVLKTIVRNLYTPNSPFSFAVLDADFLGLVYESSLAEHLTISTNGNNKTVALNPKREYAQRDVVTTPQPLVDATVEASLEQCEAGYLPRTLDFAVGSGRFLIAAFKKLSDLEVRRRLNLPGQPGLLKVSEDSYRLSFEAKKELLTEKLFGIDIDYNAVEVARFSLIVHLLEDETSETLPQNRTQILPHLSKNIIHGNTLVRQLPETVPLDAREATHAIYLEHVGIPGSYDLIIGNPPYMKTKEMRSYNKWEHAYIRENYDTAFQQFDKYFAFVEFAVQHLSPAGVLGVIIPNKWMTIEAGKRLRTLLRTSVSMRRLVNFRHVQLFDDKSIYVCMLIATRSSSSHLRYSEPEGLDVFLNKASHEETLTEDDLPKNPESALVLPANPLEKVILEKIHQNSTPMRTVITPKNGVQTSANRIMVITNPRMEDGFVKFSKGGKNWSIEEGVTRPYLDDSVSIRSHFEVQADARIIFPYRPTSSDRSQSGFEVIPEPDMKRQYPKAFNYLTTHRDFLASRDVAATERKKAFYVYGRTQAIGYCTQAPKIFYSTNQRGEKYGLDTSGIVYQSGGTAGEIALYPLDKNYSMDFILALLDQPVIEFFLRKRGSAFRGGYYARGTAVIGDVPVPHLDFTNATDNKFHEDISADMVTLRQLHANITDTPERKLTQHLAKIAAIKDRIQKQFLARWSLSSETTASLRL